jgi:ribosomal protein L35
MKSHNLEKKSPKRKRLFASDEPVAPSDVRTVRKLLGKGTR